MRTRAVSLLLVAALAVGCGDDRSVSASASQRLSEQVAAVRAAAISGDVAAAGLHLEAIRLSVDELQGFGELSAQGADRVLAAVAAVEAELGSVPTTTTTTAPPPTTTASPPPTSSPPREKDDDDGEGRGKDGDRGKENDDD